VYVCMEGESVVNLVMVNSQVVKPLLSLGMRPVLKSRDNMLF
jgi:hypothetical protein